MPFQKLFQLLMAHPRFGPQLINKIADSMPIRWAAKLTASIFLRGKHAIEQQIRDPKSRNPHNEAIGQNFDANRFKQTLTKEIQKEWEKVKKGEERR